MIAREEVRAVLCARAARSIVSEPDEVRGVVTVPADMSRWPDRHGDLCGKSLS
jgi:hypothetical protein